LGRRVVVTGIGLICGVGNTTGEVWQGVLAGKSGVGRITQFDSAAFACQIAAEVKNFDPLNFIEKKEVKKMGRFIHLAIAAADEAFKMSGLKITPENAERVGVHLSLIHISVNLNDKYELDGRDPNGYAGVAWAIVGKFDRPWFERPIFGQIRYMSGASTGKKFNSKKYIQQNLTPHDLGNELHLRFG